MRFRTSFAFILVISSLISNSPAMSAVKSGSTCSKAGQTVISGLKKFTCIKTGKKLTWDKGVIYTVPKSTSPSTPTSSPSQTSTPKAYDPVVNGFKTACDLDPLTPAEWKEMEAFYASRKFCQGIYRIKKVVMGDIKPTISLTGTQNLNPLETCKIKNSNQNSRNQAFANPQRVSDWKLAAFPAPQMVVQIVPIVAPDTAKAKNSPKSDYDKYFKFFKDWVEYSSDVPTSVEIRIPEKYLTFDRALAPYEVTHESHHLKNEPFTKELIRQVDPYINFSGVNFTIVVVPPGTAHRTIFQANLGPLQTNEGAIGNGAVLPAETFEFDPNFPHSGLIQPNWMIHEFFHVGVGFDDRYGNSNFFNNPSGGNLQDSGLGGMTLMSTSRSDLSAWEKWLLGYISDSQVACVSPSASTQTWISPSTYKTTNQKLIVIPISSTKVIAIESIRSAGLSYKLDKDSHGAFVYLIDTTATEHGRGMQGLYPGNRKPTLISHDDIYYRDAPFKLGESLTIEGVKISIMDTGEFGEVVKVEQA